MLDSWATYKGQGTLTLFFGQLLIGIRGLNNSGFIVALKSLVCDCSYLSVELLKFELFPRFLCAKLLKQARAFVLQRSLGKAFVLAAIGETLAASYVQELVQMSRVALVENMSVWEGSNTMGRTVAMLLVTA